MIPREVREQIEQRRETVGEQRRRFRAVGMEDAALLAAGRAAGLAEALRILSEHDAADRAERERQREAATGGAEGGQGY